MIIDIQDDQLETVKQILEHTGLPTADIHEVDWFSLVGWQDEKKIYGVAGLEYCDDCLLLRSVAIVQDRRGLGLGAKLVWALHDKASEAGFKKCYLLTLDADYYFKQNFEYRTIDRSDAPPAISRSRQFSGVCPDSATLMEKQLSPHLN